MRPACQLLVPYGKECRADTAEPARFSRTGKRERRENALVNDRSTSDAFRTAAELGRLLREHRKSRGLTLDTVSGLSNVGVRFLSEVERGKPTAEIGKVLKVLGTLGLEIGLRPRAVAGHAADRAAPTDG